MEAICARCRCYESAHETVEYRGSDKPRACLNCDSCKRFVAQGSENARGFPHDSLCEAELTSHGYTPCRCEKRMKAAPALLIALTAVVDNFGPWHDDECPGDDTCKCSAKPIHDMVNAAIREAE